VANLIIQSGQAINLYWLL